MLTLFVISHKIWDKTLYVFIKYNRDPCTI